MKLVWFCPGCQKWQEETVKVGKHFMEVHPEVLDEFPNPLIPLSNIRFVKDEPK